MTLHRKLSRALTLALMPFVFAVSFLVPRDDELWVFMAGDDGVRFADNAKYLFLYCARQDVRCVWITSSVETRDTLQQRGYEAELATSSRGRRTMLRAGVFFETHGPVWPEYTGGARIVHLTHGNYLKQMLTDHTRDWPRPVEAVVDLLFGRRRKHAVTARGRPAENTQSMHDIPDDRLLVTGFPRNDVLVGQIRGERLGLNESALDTVADRAREGPVVLYAPTWRDAYGEQNGIPLSELDLGLAELDEVFAEHGGHLYLSPHPASSLDAADDLQNVSVLDSGGDLYPFMRHCDALITDYSGIFYDYLLLDRPVVFYAPDLAEYLADRDLYFEYEEHVPGPIARDGTELVETISDLLDGVDSYGDERATLREEFYENPDGEAAARMYRAVREWTQRA